MFILEREFRDRVPGAEMTGGSVFSSRLSGDFGHFPVAALADLDGCRVEAGRSDGHRKIKGASTLGPKRPRLFGKV
jgi:hypothetical protein